MLRQMMIFVLIGTFVPSLALAQDLDPTVAEAREHFSRGEMAYRQERWLDCATHFEASFQSVFAPELLYNIGLCYERASDTRDDIESIPYMERALSAYTRYLRELPNSADALSVSIRVEDLRILLARARSVEIDEAEEVEENIPPPEEAAPPEVTEPEESAAVDLTVPELPPLDRGFGFGWTLTGAAFTVASFVVAVGLGLAASECYSNSSCTSSEGYALQSGANTLFLVSGTLLAATGVAFGLEFHFSQ